MLFELVYSSESCRKNKKGELTFETQYIWVYVTGYCTEII